MSLLVLVVAVAVTIEHSKQGLAGELTPATPAFRDAAAELATIVPAGARFSLTRDYPAEIERVGVIEPARWLAWASGVDTLNAFNPESSQAGAVAYTADAPNPGESIDDWVRALRRLGVADIVVDKPVIEARMVNRPLVQEVWNEGPVAIFRSTSTPGPGPRSSSTPTPTASTRGPVLPREPRTCVGRAIAPRLRRDDRGGLVAEMARRDRRPDRAGRRDLRRHHAGEYAGG